MDYSELRNSISSWLDGAIEPEELSDLKSLLTESADARRVYLELMSVHAELCNSATAQDCLRTLAEVDADLAVEVDSVRGSKKSWGFLAIAAGLLIALGVWQSVESRNQDLSRSAGNSEILDRIEPASEDCKWYVERAKRTHPNFCLPGDIVRVTSGKLELEYVNGTKVVLHSPAAYQLIDDMQARILLGRLSATITDAGKGFSVLTPRATVIDLGTEFGIKVNDDGATDVVVFKGVVDIDYNDHTDHSNARRLHMGEAVHLDAVGTVSRIVSINGLAYSTQALEELSRPAVISQVYDNVERTSSLMSYYEIVHQGMREDALAYVDRIAHQWNGVDEKGMPSYLNGADYVKMFNSDKYDFNISVGVKLDVPAKLYVLFDDRLPIPAWLRKGFQDTGDNIGMDTGPFLSRGELQNPDTPPGVGPGDSVEDILSVWVKEVPEPGIVYLSSTEIHQPTSNMYGIAAVPLNSP
jgi:ferric-dicitrate binding protein FerR (iron transport regulator)